MNEVVKTEDYIKKVNERERRRKIGGEIKQKRKSAQRSSTTQSRKIEGEGPGDSKIQVKSSCHNLVFTWAGNLKMLCL